MRSMPQWYSQSMGPKADFEREKNFRFIVMLQLNPASGGRATTSKYLYKALTDGETVTRTPNWVLAKRPRRISIV